jgi:hypothetical protein
MVGYDRLAIKKGGSDMPILDSLFLEHLEVSILKGERAGKKERYSYDVLYEELTDEGKQAIFENFYRQYHADEISLRCLCNPDATIEMVPVNGEQSFYIRSIQGKKHLHLQGCNFEGKNKSNYHANWVVDEETGEIRVRFEEPFTIEKAKKLQREEEGEEDEEEKQPPRERTNTYNRISLYAFFMRLLLEAWNVRLRNHKVALDTGKQSKYPDLPSVYKSIETYWSTKIVFGKNRVLQKVLYSGRADISRAAYAVKKEYKLNMMTLLQYESVEDINDSHCLVKARHLSAGNEVDILCEKSMWDSAISSLSGIEAPYLVGGWVYDTGYGKPVEYRSISVVPVSQNGVIVDSSYERSFYNQCHTLNRLILRPYNLKYYPSWHGMLPDGLFLDTPVQTIVEIFGMSENQVEYHERKEQKIAHFTTLFSAKKPFDFWFWNAYQGDHIPELPANVYENEE